MTRKTDDLREEVVAVMRYHHGSYYVGGMATAHVTHLLNGQYGKDSVVDLIQTAEPKKVREVHKYLRPYLTYMKKHPMVQCPCCHQMVDAHLVNKENPACNTQ